MDATTFDKHFAPTVANHFHTIVSSKDCSLLYAESGPVMDSLLIASRIAHPDIKSENILVVTTGLFRTISAASALDIPCLWLKRSGAVESCSLFRFADPICVVEQLSAIPAILGNKALIPVDLNNEEWEMSHMPSFLLKPYYYCNSYLHLRGFGEFQEAIGRPY